MPFLRVPGASKTSSAAFTCSVASTVIQNTEMARERLAKKEPLLGADVGDNSGRSAESKCDSHPTQ